MIDFGNINISEAHFGNIELDSIWFGTIKVWPDGTPPVPPTPTVYTFSVSPTALTTDDSAKTVYLTVSTDSPEWSVSAAENWITVNGITGATVEVSIGANSSISDRNGALEFEYAKSSTGGTDTYTVEVAQEGLVIHDNIIIYTATNNQVVTPNITTGYGANIISNTYNDGVGIITFNGAVTAVPDSAFSACTQLYTVEIPKSVTTLGSNAFRDCSGLTDVTVYTGITSIGSYCFWNCSGITSFDIPNTVTVVDARAFGRCQGLTAVTIPSSVTTIGETAFGVTKLYNVSVPNSVTLLGRQAFLDCKSLLSITFGTGITAIENYVVGRCNALATINYNGTKSQWNSLTKGSNWHLNVPATVVHCSNGDVAI